MAVKLEVVDTATEREKEQPKKDGSKQGTESKAAKQKESTPEKRDSDDENSDSLCLFVVNINRITDEVRLAEVCQHYGAVRYVKLAREARTGVSKCYAFVCFFELESRVAACEGMKGMFLDGRTVHVEAAKVSKSDEVERGCYYPWMDGTDFKAPIHGISRTQTGDQANIMRTNDRPVSHTRPDAVADQNLPTYNINGNCAYEREEGEVYTTPSPPPRTQFSSDCGSSGGEYYSDYDRFGNPLHASSSVHGQDSMVRRRNGSRESHDYRSDNSHTPDMDANIIWEPVHLREVFIRNLPENVSPERLAWIFGRCGSVEVVRVMPAKCIGTVTFWRAHSADYALRRLNGYEIGGRVMRLSRFDDGGPNRGYSDRRCERRHLFAPY